MRIKLTTATLALAVVTTGLLAPSKADAGQTSTPVVMNCASVSGTVTGQFTITMSAPDQVATATTFTDQFDVAVGEFFSIPAPYSGTISMQFGFSASNATPASFTLTTPTTHFNEGDFLPAVSLDQQLTATGGPGTAISVQFLSFGYTIVPDAGEAFSEPCQANPAAVVGTIPITLPGRQPKDECKNGGWQHLADAAGIPFSNQGHCIRTSVGARKN
jgi:hypothetical protein